jgi:hypothetical protein
MSNADVHYEFYSLLNLSQLFQHINHILSSFLFMHNATGNVSVTDLGKFNPDDFKTHETAFINLLAQTDGAEGKNLKYIMCDVIIPAEFVNGAKWHHMYQLPLTGEVCLQHG